MMNGLVRHAELIDLMHDIGKGEGGGIAEIGDDLQLALAELDHVGRHREPARIVFELRQTVLIVEETVDDILDDAVALKIPEDGKDGVLAELGRGTVRAFSVGDELFPLRR